MVSRFDSRIGTSKPPDSAPDDAWIRHSLGIIAVDAGGHFRAPRRPTATDFPYLCPGSQTMSGCMTQPRHKLHPGQGSHHKEHSEGLGFIYIGLVTCYRKPLGAGKRRSQNLKRWANLLPMQPRIATQTGSHNKSASDATTIQLEQSANSTHYVRFHTKYFEKMAFAHPATPHLTQWPQTVRRKGGRKEGKKEGVKLQSRSRSCGDPIGKGRVNRSRYHPMFAPC